MAQKLVTQHSFQGYEDDNAINTGTAIAGEDTDFSVDVDVIFHLRIGVAESNNKQESSVYELWANYNGTGYALVGATGAIQYANGAHTDGGATTQRLGSAGQTWTDGEYSEDGITGTVALKAEETEVQYSIMFDSVAVGAGGDGNTTLFEIRRSGGGSIEAYGIRPTVTVNVPAEARRVFITHI